MKMVIVFDFPGPKWQEKIQAKQKESLLLELKCKQAQTPCCQIVFGTAPQLLDKSPPFIGNSILLKSKAAAALLQSFLAISQLPSQLNYKFKQLHKQMVFDNFAFASP